MLTACLSTSADGRGPPWAPSSQPAPTGHIPRAAARPLAGRRGTRPGGST
ncbi:hypothetical protein [Phytohabitans maris]